MIRLRRKGKVAVAILLVSCLIVGYLPIKQLYASQLLGTDLALGSPLLNDSFNNEQWDKWEIVVFGMFLSNLVYPIDDYRTAFTNNNSGSKGNGFKALDFGTGSDSHNHEVLKIY